MQEELTPEDSGAEHLVPLLAAALGRLHRVPDRDEGWVPLVLSRLERERPADHGRLRRRLGFAGALAAMVPLQDEERAALSAGLFFHEVAAGDAPAGGKEEAAWTTYLVGHGDWLAPCYEVSAAIDSPDWDSSDGGARAVAKVAAAFDLETIEHHGRPLQVLQSLRPGSSSEAARQVIELLWSEAGQELCNRHVRRPNPGYVLNPEDLQSSLRLLKPSSRPVETEVPEAPQRLSGRAFQAHAPDAEEVGAEHDEEAGRSEDFDLRRRALRSGPAWNRADANQGAGSGWPPAPPADEPEAGGELPAEPGLAENEEPQPDEPDAEREEGRGVLDGLERRRQALRSGPAWNHAPSAADSGAAGADLQAPSGTKATEPAPARNFAPTGPGHSEPTDLGERVEALQAKLDQIARVSAEGQTLLASAVAELEAISALLPDRRMEEDSGEQAS